MGSRLSALLPTFKRIKVHLSTGKTLRIKVRRSLLSSVGEDPAAILHLNGTEIYIPKGGGITIGRAKTCDIRIKDAAIGSSHLMISSSEGKLQVKNFDVGGRKVAIREAKSHKITSLSAADFESLSAADSEWKILTNDMDIIFKLSGIKKGGGHRFLPMQLKMPQNVSEEISALFEDMQRPQIEQISLELALARAGKDQAVTITGIIDGPINSTALKGTIFEGVKTISELVEAYYLNYKKAEVTADEYKRVGAILANVSAIPVIPAALHVLFVTSGISLIFGLCAAAIALLGFHVEDHLKKSAEEEKPKFNDTFSKVLSHLKTNQITKILAAIETQKREEIITLFEEIDSARAEEVKKRLPAAIDATLSQQEDAETGQDLSTHEEKPSTTALADMEAELGAEDGRGADAVDPKKEIE